MYVHLCIRVNAFMVKIIFFLPCYAFISHAYSHIILVKASIFIYVQIHARRFYQRFDNYIFLLLHFSCRFLFLLLLYKIRNISSLLLTLFLFSRFYHLNCHFYSYVYCCVCLLYRFIYFFFFSCNLQYYIPISDDINSK